MPGIEILDETGAVAFVRTLARQQWLQQARALGIIVDTDG